MKGLRGFKDLRGIKEAALKRDLKGLKGGFKGLKNFKSVEEEGLEGLEGGFKSLKNLKGGFKFINLAIVLGVSFADQKYKASKSVPV